MWIKMTVTGLITYQYTLKTGLLKMSGNITHLTPTHYYCVYRIETLTKRLMLIDEGLL